MFTMSFLVEKVLRMMGGDGDFHSSPYETALSVSCIGRRRFCKQTNGI